MSKLPALVVLLMTAAPASAQSWIDFVSREDYFAINFPGQPTVEAITWTSEQEAKLPARVYRYDGGATKYAITVVDYSDAERINAERAKSCPPDAQSRCSGSVTMGVGSWIVDVQGAMAWSLSKFMTRPGSRVTFFGWFYQDLIEGLQAQVTNADGSRTYAAVHMHDNRLYVVEATAAKGAPEPGLFQQALQFVDKDGKSIRYETVYSNRYPRPRRTR